MYISSLIALVIGALMIYLGFTGNFDTFLNAVVNKPSGYATLDPVKYLLAAAVVVLPVKYLEIKYPDKVWSYVALILVSMIVYYYVFIEKAVSGFGFEKIAEPVSGQEKKGR